MQPSLHPTAIIQDGAILGEDVFIGAYAVIERGASLGSRSVVKAHAVVKEYARIQEEVTVNHFAVVGGDPQIIGFDSKISSFVEIGANTVIGEGVTIHRSYEEGGRTRVGKNCFLMGNSHIAHDCQLGDHTILANGALLGGHVEVGESVFVGGGAAVHQFVRIGSGVMVGGLAEISVDVPPFLLISGRNQSSGLNRIGLSRNNIAQASIAELKKLYLELIKNYGSPAKRAAEILASGEYLSAEAKDFLSFLVMEKRRYVRHRS